MNFLAHLYLSGSSTKIMIGNFIGDFVKGRKLTDRFEPGIAGGIEMHRAIDMFTDSHPIVSKSKDRLRPKYRHYSGVIVDVFYDHFLSSTWAKYSVEPLDQFAGRVYQIMQQNLDLLPESVQKMLPHMIRGNWLVNYSKLAGIHQALSGMASRTPYESKMEQATADLELSYQGFKSEFEEFFPLLREWAAQWIEEHPFN